MSKLLLFSLFVFCVVSSSRVLAATMDEPAVPDGSAVTIDRLASVASADPTSSDHSRIDNSSTSDDVCFNIHAFIFKAEDDRVPKLVRETTCMPAGRVRAKKADQNLQPRLLPATGDASF